MLFNSTQRRRTLPGLELPVKLLETGAGQPKPVEVLHGCRPARVVRCWLSPATSATLVASYHHSLGTLARLPVINRRKVGMTSSHHGPYVQATNVLQWPGQRLRDREVELIPKTRSQFRLEAAIRLHEVGIASNRRSACCGEYVPGPCTHRPSHHESRLFQKSLLQPARELGAKGKAGNWGEVVTGSRIGRCGWITSFLGKELSDHLAPPESGIQAPPSISPKVD